MRKLEFLPSTVSVNISVVALPIVPKVEFIFQIMLYIVIFLYESTGSCFKSGVDKTWGRPYGLGHGLPCGLLYGLLYGLPVVRFFKPEHNISKTGTDRLA